MPDEPQPTPPAEPQEPATGTEGPGEPPQPVDQEPAKGAEVTAEDVEKWKSLARKHEARAKENAEKAKRLDELDEANKSEIQKAQDRVTAEKKRADEAAAQLALLKAAVKHKLTEDDLELLADVPADQIEDRAARLAKRIQASEKAKDFGGGHRGGDVGDGVKQWTQADLQGKSNAEVEKARKAGHLNRLMGKSA